jgi:hypothetical protein
VIIVNLYTTNVVSNRCKLKVTISEAITVFVFLEGFKEAAEKFRMESGVQPTSDLDQMDERIKIRDAIQNGKIQDAISLVNNIHPELLDNDRYLYFHLQLL